DRGMVRPPIARARAARVGITAIDVIGSLTFAVESHGAVGISLRRPWPGGTLNQAHSLSCEPMNIRLSPPDLSGVAEQVVRRAQEKGAVGARDIRAELTRAGCDPARWKEVLSLAGPSLMYCRGRYQYLNPTAARVRQEEQQLQIIQRAVRGLIRYHRQ